MLNHAEFQAELLNVLSPIEVERVLPLIEKQLLDTRNAVKVEAISLVRDTFPDPHEPDEECSDCLLIDSLVQTLEVYLPVSLVQEHE